MIELKQLAGILNSDDPNQVIPINHHKMARNGRFRGNQGNMQFEGVPGNVEIPFNRPAGNNECIGSFYDPLNQKIYWANYNSNSRNGWYQLDINTKTVTPLLVSFTNSISDIFDFDLNYPIPSIVLMYGSDIDGDTLLYTDRRGRPKKINIKDALANTYGSSWLEEYLTVARTTPPAQPTCSYANDNTVNINNLRSTLYQFRYRFVYKDNTKSTWSAYSKLFAPVNPDDLATNIDPTKNNRIDIVLNTGNSDCIAIEIAGRHSIVSTFTDNFLIINLNKADLGIADNSVYTYNFFNDSSYPDIDPRETNLLWSYVPQLANTLELLNGNVIIYGATTEGYDYTQTQDVTLSVTSIDNSSSTGLTINQIGTTYTNTTFITLDTGALLYTLSGGVTGVTSVRLSFTSHRLSGDVSDTVLYTLNPGDTITNVINGLFALFPTTNFNAIITSDAENTVPPNSILVFDNLAGTTGYISIDGSFTITTSSVGNSDVNIAMFHHLSKYQLARVYFDQYDETNGVIYNSDLIFTTPEVDTTGQTQMKIPQVNVSVNDQPPDWAVKFSWVLTNSLTYATTLTTVSSNTGQDGTYGYLDITPQQINQNQYPSYTLVHGDRVRIIGKYGSAVNMKDVPVVDLVTGPNIAGSNKTGSWLKVPYVSSIMSSWGSAGFEHFTIEIYTPAISTSKDLQVYYEIGQEFPVINPGASNRAHGGMTQDQIVGTQPALYSFTRADWYIRTRVLQFNDTLTDPRIVWLTDQSVSDQYPSKVKNNGRAYVIDNAANQQFYMTRSRWSEAYQQNTNINQTNIFYPLNLDEIDRAKGQIQRFKVRDRILRVFQERACAQYGVYAKYIQNNAGQSQLVTTDDIITTNNINYYLGELGLGSQYCGLVSGKVQDYYVDPVRGYQVRLSDDGNIAISELYKGQYYIRTLLTPYNKVWTRTDGSNAKILGCYDYFEEQYMCILQGGTSGTNSISNYAFSFNETRNAYCSFYDILNPDWIMSAEDLIYSWKNGRLYVHNNENQWANFYGTQYSVLIELIFNDKMPIRKTFNNLSYQSNLKWASATNGDVFTSEYNEQTGLQQISQLKEIDYTQRGNYFDAALLRDANSMSNAQLAVCEGDFLEGQYFGIILKNNSGKFIYLFEPYLNWQQNNRNF